MLLYSHIFYFSACLSHKLAKLHKTGTHCLQCVDSLQRIPHTYTTPWHSNKMLIQQMIHIAWFPWGWVGIRNEDPRSRRLTLIPATWSLFRTLEIVFSAYVPETKTVAPPPHKDHATFWRQIMQFSVCLVGCTIIQTLILQTIFPTCRDCIKLSSPRGLQWYVDCPFSECLQLYGPLCHVNVATWIPGLPYTWSTW